MCTPSSTPLVLCRVGRKTLTRSINQSINQFLSVSISNYFFLIFREEACREPLVVHSHMTLVVNNSLAIWRHFCLHGPIRQRRLWERLFKRRFINGLTYAFGGRMFVCHSAAWTSVTTTASPASVRGTCLARAQWLKYKFGGPGTLKTIGALLQA